MIPSQTIEDIRNKADIVGIVSEYLKLRKTGKNYVGLCPFHGEKTPSFTISPDKQLFHCFGCGAGGNIFTFLMKIENLNFAEAVEELGKKVGILVEKISSPQAKGLKERLYEVMLLALKFYQEFLDKEEGKLALGYLKKRGISEQTRRIFNLGFAPEGWDELFKHLISRGVSPEWMEKAGLTLPREGKSSYYDRFRRRLIFPIFDLRGRLLAFSGRSLGEEEPKYLNSPDTLIYHKGESFFGLNLSKELIKKQKTVILVEGNIDLLISFQAGVTPVVSSLGTALTPNQCKILARFADNIILAYDSDTAGGLAAERAVQLLKDEGLKVKVADLSPFKDPDEMIQKSGVSVWQKALAEALPWLEFKIKRILNRFNLEEVESKALALREIAALLSQEKDRLVQHEYIKRISKGLKIEEEILTAEVKREGFYKTKVDSSLKRITEKPTSKLLLAEKHLLALACQNREVLQEAKKQLTPEDFHFSETQPVARSLWELNLEKREDLTHFLLEKEIAPESQKWLTEISVLETLPQDKIPGVVADYVKVIREKNLQEKMISWKQELYEAEQKGNHAKVSELLHLLKSEIR